MDHPTEGEVYVLENRETKDRFLATACSDGNWQSIGCDWPDINNWDTTPNDYAPSDFKAIAHVDVKELKFTEVSLD